MSNNIINNITRKSNARKCLQTNSFFQNIALGQLKNITHDPSSQQAAISFPACREKKIVNGMFSP